MQVCRVASTFKIIHKIQSKFVFSFLLEYIANIGSLLVDSWLSVVRQAANRVS